jgi:hypothetical protein
VDLAERNTMDKGLDWLRNGAVTVLTGLLAACDGVTDGDDVDRRRFDFSQAAPGWQAGFAQVAVAQEDSVRFVGDHRPLPDPLGPTRKALYHAGFNASDDLMMYFTDRLDGLVPGASYDAGFEVSIVSNVHQGCDVGVGSLVSVKAVASAIEPRRTVAAGYYLLNVDTGDGAMADGTAALRPGDIRNGLPGCPSERRYAEKTLSTGSRTLPVTAAADGSLWLLIATDSAFETQHHLYFTAVTITLRRR